MKLQEEKFWGTTLMATRNDLRKVLGKPCYFNNKVKEDIKIIWKSKTRDGRPFTIHDLMVDHVICGVEDIRWRIEGLDYRDTMQAHEEVIHAIIAIS